jgi:hypothetical protein
MEAVVKNNAQNLDTVEKKLVQALKEVTEEYDKLLSESDKTTTWITTKIKEKIRAIGYSHECDVCPSEDNPEWLYDLVWYKNNSEDNLEKVVLVLESELSDRSERGLKYDFEKLLCSNADYRVFICFVEANFDYPHNINRQFERFEKYVSSYANLSKEERVLVLIWEDYETGVIFPHLIVK